MNSLRRSTRPWRRPNVSLLKGTHDNIVQENIKDLIRSGRSEQQATAIALKQAGKSKAPSGKPMPKPGGAC